MRSARRSISAAARRENVKDAAGIDAVDDQVGDAMRQGVGLARTCSRDDEQRRRRRAVLFPNAVLDGTSLL
jgi:hypothetical protein